MRKLMIVLAAIATISAGATLPAFARGGGGHGGGGHGGHGGGHSMGHGGLGHGGFGRAGVARAAFARPVGIGRMAVARSQGWHGQRFAGKHRFAFRHHRFHRRFAFIGAGFAYSAYDSCISPVWTPWGWRWTNVCY